MSPNLSRRVFFQRSFAAAALTALGPTAKAFGFEEGIHLDGADLTCARMLSCFGDELNFCGGAVAAKRAGMDSYPAARIFMRLTDPAALAKCLSSPRRHGISTARGSESCISFRIADREYEVELLDLQALACRFDDLAVGRGLTFAHEAMQFAPETGCVRDPLAAGSTLRLVQNGSDPAASMAALTSGIIEARQYGLTESGQFITWKGALLESHPNGRADAVTRAFFRNIAPLAEAISPVEMTQLLQARLLERALHDSLGIDVAEAIRRFDALAQSSQSKAGRWSAALLGRQIAQGTADPLMNSLHGATRTANRCALREAQKLVA